MKKLGLFLACVSGLYAQTGASPFDIAYPSPSTGISYLNVVTDCSANNAGVDTTSALIACMHRSHDGESGGAYYKQILYFPSGTYLISASILAQGSTAGSWSCCTEFQGQNSTTTTIKLAPGTFTSTSCTPLFTGSGTLCPAILELASSSSQFGEDGYNNDVRDLTIDTNGNAGAMAIQWQCSNAGVLRNVIIKGGGMVGIGLNTNSAAGPGPCMAENINVSGSFQYGIAMPAGEVGTTWEHIGVSGATVSAVFNNNGSQFVDLEVVSPAGANGIISSGGGNTVMTVINSTFTSSGGTVPAINNGRTLFVRNSTSTGYSSLINGMAGGNVAEYSSTGSLCLFSGACSATSLNLPINNTPQLINDNNFTHWANIESATYGSGGCGSSTATNNAAIQNALNSGLSTVYFPKDCSYSLSGTFTVPSSVCRILGFYATLASSATFQFNESNATTCPIVEFRQFVIADVSIPVVNLVDNMSNGIPLVVRDVLSHNGFSIDSLGVNGTVIYTDNVAFGGGPLTVRPQTSAWCRSCNIESRGHAFLNNLGGTAWALGFKSEGAINGGTGNVFTGGSGAGKTEVLGAFFSAADASPSQQFGIGTNTGQTSVSGIAFNDNAATWTQFVTETRGATTNTGGSQYMGLYTGFNGGGGGGGGGGTCPGGGPGMGAICVQLAANNSTTGPVTFLDAAFSSAVAVHDSIIVGCAYFDTGFPVITVTDNKSQTYTAAHAVVTLSSGLTLQVFTSVNVAAGATTPRCNFAAGVGFPAMTAIEYSGLVTSSLVDGANTNSGTSLTTLTGGNVTTTTSDVIFGFEYATQSLSSVPVGTYLRVLGTPNSDGASDVTQTSTGTYSSSFTLAATGDMVASTTALKISGAVTAHPRGTIIQ